MEALRLLFLLFFITLFGCAYTLTPDQREWRRHIDAENWRSCVALYRDSGVYTLHIGHTHDLHRGKRKIITNTDYFNLRSDLKDNLCRMYLRGYWIEYGSYGTPDKIVKESNGETKQVEQE